MKKGMILSLPNSDLVTQYISHYSSFVEKEAENKNIPIKKLCAEEANMKEFNKVVTKLNYSFIFINGHGSESEIFGQREPLLKTGINHELMKDRVVYARSCNSALVLGKACVENSKGCYIGYNLPFQFYNDENWSGNPEKDPLAGLFIEPSNLIPISLIKGNSAEFADENSKQIILKRINKTLKEKSEGAFEISLALWNNYFGQVILGNKKARL